MRGGTRPSALAQTGRQHPDADRKSTRLNSSHLVISYAVFCLKKKKYILLKRTCTAVERVHTLSAPNSASVLHSSNCSYNSCLDFLALPCTFIVHIQTHEVRAY